MLSVSRFPSSLVAPASAAPRRSISSEYSIISSFDTLSLSSATSHSLSESSPQSSHSPYMNDPPFAESSTKTSMAGRSKAAARRERKRKLQAGQRERQAAAIAQAEADAEVLFAELELAMNMPMGHVRPTSPHTPRSACSSRPSCSPISSVFTLPCAVEDKVDVELVSLQVPDRPPTAIPEKNRIRDAEVDNPERIEKKEIEKPITNEAEVDEEGNDLNVEDEAESEAIEEMGQGMTRRKTRRGGVKARRRAGRAQARAAGEEPVLTESIMERNEARRMADRSRSATPVITLATPPRNPTPVRAVAQVRPRITYNIDRYTRSQTNVKIDEKKDDEDEDEDEDEVDDLSVLESEPETPLSESNRFLRECSVMTVEDATSSIDRFLSDPRHFMTIKANKLRLWQSLCVELGLVHMPSHEQDGVFMPNSEDDENSISPKRHEFPQTLTQARKLLKDHAHVNLVDYLEARRLCPLAPAYVGAYQGLLYPSKSSMLKYTKKQGKFADKSMVKIEWLEPLMKDWRVSKKVV